MEFGKLTPKVHLLNETRFITINKRYESKMMDLLQKSLVENMSNAEMLHAGGAGYKVLCLIDGIADCYIYPSLGLMRWDTCAPEAILRSMNGSLTDVFNRSYNYERENDVANLYGLLASMNETNVFYAESLVKELKELVNLEANAYLTSK